MQSPVSYSVPIGSVAATSAPSGSAPSAYPGVNPARSFVSSLARYQQANAERRQAVEAARNNVSGMLRSLRPSYQLPSVPKGPTDTPVYGRPVSRGDGSTPMYGRPVSRGGLTAGRLYGIGM